MNTSVLFAPSVTSNAWRSGSASLAASYAAINATIAVSEIASATFETSPVPNQRITIGANAILGTLLMATMNGSISRATNGEYHSASPHAEPTAVPNTNPRIASNSV